MNSLFILFISLLVFVWGYSFYAKKLERIWGIDPKRTTPAHTKFDSIDFIPAKNRMVLFGHHFSSIAGAGPVIGPVIAVMLWGWIPALLWVLIGSVFIGGLHDFGSLITSVREGGESISNIAGHVISKRSRILFSLFVLLALILIIAVFAYLCADTFVKQPKIVLPSLGLIPVAIVVGYLLYYLRANTLITTLFGLSSLIALIYAGNMFPVRGASSAWIIALFLYCYLASVLPVNILLQPRDYISSFLLIFGLIIGCLGVISARPEITIQGYINPSSQQGSLWPMLFVTIACGAISGFHSLIASGTSSKQISNEAHVKDIGYAGMLTEGLLAVLTIIAVSVIFKPGDNLVSALNESGPIEIFSRGFGVITKGILGGFGGLIAVTILNAFILTTLDTATRISRYLFQELFGIKNRFVSTAVVLACSFSLAVSGQWNKIWPAFGSSNQLIAALTFFVLGAWLVSKNKPARVVLLPAVFMLITAVGALIVQAIIYFKQGDVFLLIISLGLIILSGLMTYDVLVKILGGNKWLKR